MNHKTKGKQILKRNIFQAILTVLFLLINTVAVSGDWKSNTAWACDDGGRGLLCPILRDAKNSGSNGLNYVDVVVSGQASCSLFSKNYNGSIHSVVNASGNDVIRLDAKSLTTWNGGNYYVRCTPDNMIVHYYWNEG